MRAAIAIVCLALVGCSREQPAATEVDLNAAAIEAKGNIANYAASRHPGHAVAGRTRR